MKKALLSLVVSAAMVLAPLPALTADTGPLAPGAAAGVKQAQLDSVPPLLWFIGAGLVIALGIVLLTNNNDDDSPAPTPSPPPSTTTTTTNP